MHLNKFKNFFKKEKVTKQETDWTPDSVEELVMLMIALEKCGFGEKHCTIKFDSDRRYPTFSITCTKEEEKKVDETLKELCKKVDVESDILTYEVVDNEDENTEN